MAEKKNDLAARIEVAKPGDIIILSKDEIDQVREMSKWWGIVGNELHDMGQEDARLWRQWLALYRKLKGVADLGGALGVFLKWAFWIGAAYIAIKTGVIDFIRDASSGGGSP